MTTTNQSERELLEISPATEWKDFIFQTQTVLIESGYVGSLTAEGRSDFSAKMTGLYDFFEELNSKKKK